MIVPATQENIVRAAGLIREGAVVAFPTETVYGLGANALDANAITKIFKIKGRPSNNPLIVHLADPSEIDSIVELGNNPQLVARLSRLEKFWPGPLTAILPKHSLVPDLVTAGRDTVAVRIPSHHVAQALIREAGVPLAAPSANRSSYVSATTAEHVFSDFGEGVRLILDGGAAPIGIESTVISLCESPPVLYRMGAITKEQLEDALGETVLPLTTGANAGASMPSPGMLAKHYAPRTPLRLRESIEISKYPKRVGLIQFQPNPAAREEFPYSTVRILSPSGDFEEVAAKLYRAIRELDSEGLDLIVVEAVKSPGLGEALIDRLTRAQL